MRISISASLIHRDTGKYFMMSKIVCLNEKRKDPIDLDIVSFDLLKRTCLCLRNNQTCYLFDLSEPLFEKVKKTYTVGNTSSLVDLVPQIYLHIRGLLPKPEVFNALKSKPIPNETIHLWAPLSIKPQDEKLFSRFWRSPHLNDYVTARLMTVPPIAPVTPPLTPSRNTPIEHQTIPSTTLSLIPTANSFLKKPSKSPL